MSQRRRERSGQQIPLFAEPQRTEPVANSWSAEMRNQLVAALAELLLAGVCSAQRGGRDERQSDG